MKTNIHRITLDTTYDRIEIADAAGNVLLTIDDYGFPDQTTESRTVTARLLLGEKDVIHLVHAEANVEAGDHPGILVEGRQHHGNYEPFVTSAGDSETSMASASWQQLPVVE